MPFPPLRFESHHALRVLEIHFPEGFCVDGTEAAQHLKREWMGALKSWHSPYTCLLDCRPEGWTAEGRAHLGALVTFFSRFFMKKLVGFGTPSAQDFPFDTRPTFEEAAALTGLSRLGQEPRALTDLRSQIQVDSDFSAHVIDVSFLAPTVLATPEDVSVLQSKIRNTLMQWHTPYWVLLQCQQLEIQAPARPAFEKLEKFLRQFFCKGLVGYAPRMAAADYPFPTYRSRHLAAGSLPTAELQSGSEANCSTRK